MKILFCKICQDLFKLTKKEIKTCICKGTQGQYNEDGDTAWIKGRNAVLFGLSNFEFFFTLEGYSENAKLFLYPLDNGKIEIRE